MAKRTKKERQQQEKMIAEEYNMLLFAVALSDAELPLALTAAYSIRDGVHTEDEAQAICERLADRLVPLIGMKRQAEEAQQQAEEKSAAITKTRPAKLILPPGFVH